MNSQELETAVRLAVNFVVLIIQDNAYGMIRWKQAADGFADFGSWPHQDSRAGLAWLSKKRLMR